MPLLNITIDDASPLIKYDGDWVQSVSNEAYDGGYTYTYGLNASATIQFWGTWIMVNGSKNHYHGTYTVSLDGTNYTLNGSVPDPGTSRTPIFTSNHLEPGLHNLTISNDEWETLDIDSITWSCDIGGRNHTNSSLETTTVDDKDSAFTWLPHGSWNMNPPNLTMFHGATGHSTNLLNASVNFTFSGEAVSIYGTTGPGHSQYSVLRPDQSPQQFSATRSLFSSKVLLYAGERFGSGNNTVTLVNEGSGLFQIDYAVVHTAKSLSSSVPVSRSSQVPAPTGTVIIPADPTIHKGLSTGVIVAITFAAFLFVFLIAALLLLLQRNKTLWYRLQRGYKVQSQFDIGTPPNGAVTPLPYSAPPPMRSKAALLNNEDEDFEAQPLNRAVTMESHLTASTLVADAGSYMTEGGGHRPFSLKALRLASRWGPGTPATSQASPTTRHSASTQHLSLSLSSSRHLSRSPSIQRLLSQDSQFYDLYAAAVAGIEEVPEDSVEEVLRHPIRRTEPSISQYHQWQSGLP